MWIFPAQLIPKNVFDVFSSHKRRQVNTNRLLNFRFFFSLLSDYAVLNSTEAYANLTYQRARLVGIRRELK